MAIPEDWLACLRWSFRTPEAPSMGEIVETGIPPYTAYQRPAPGHAQAGRASSWARSRPCIVVGADLTMRRPAGLLDLRRRCAAARRGVRGFETCFGVLPALSSSSPVVDVAPGGAPPPRRRRGRASRCGLRGGHRQPRAGRRRGLRGLCCSVARPSSIKLASTCGGVGAALYHLDVFAGIL